MNGTKECKQLSVQSISCWIVAEISVACSTSVPRIDAAEARIYDWEVPCRTDGQQKDGDCTLQAEGKGLGDDGKLGRRCQSPSIWHLTEAFLCRFVWSLLPMVGAGVWLM